MGRKTGSKDTREPRSEKFFAEAISEKDEVLSEVRVTFVLREFIRLAKNEIKKGNSVVLMDMCSLHLSNGERDGIALTVKLSDVFKEEIRSELGKRRFTEDTDTKDDGERG